MALQTLDCKSDILPDTISPIFRDNLGVIQYAILAESIVLY